MRVHTRGRRETRIEQGRDDQLAHHRIVFDHKNLVRTHNVPLPRRCARVVRADEATVAAGGYRSVSGVKPLGYIRNIGARRSRRGKAASGAEVDIAERDRTDTVVFAIRLRPRLRSPGRPRSGLRIGAARRALCAGGSGHGRIALRMSGGGAQGKGENEALQGFHGWTPKKQQSVLRRDKL